MSSFEFRNGYSADKPCPYEIGQFVPQFYPMNYEANIVLTKTSFDVIIGLADNPEIQATKSIMDQINFFLCCIDKIPILKIWNGHHTFNTYVNVFDYEYADPIDWINESDDEVNIVVVDDLKSYKVTGIRKIKLPLMKRIREICQEQLQLKLKSLVDSEFDRIMCYYSDNKLVDFHEEECRFGKIADGDIQTGTYTILSIDRNKLKSDANPYLLPSRIEMRNRERIKKMQKKLNGFPKEYLQ